MILSLRLNQLDHFDQEYMDELVEALVQSGKSFDEVWFASSYGMKTVERCREFADAMANQSKKLRAIGITPSMQISRTTGHGTLLLKNNGGEGIEGLNLGEIVDMNGNVCETKFCWNDERYRQYIFETTKAYASWKPEIVWVDDDMRVTGLGANNKALCWCDHCISLFNEQYGHCFDRERLTQEFLYGDRKIRKEYVEFNIKSLAGLARVVAEAVHDAAPETRMALQNIGTTTLSTNTQNACLDAMREVCGSKEPAFRAGSGFYADHHPRGMFDKAMEISYINSRLPEYVKLRSCEIENLPYVAYGQSVEGTFIEAVLYMAYGCNMASVTLMNRNEPLSFHKRMFAKAAQYRPYLEKLAEHNEGSVNCGMVVFQPEQSWLAYQGENCPNLYVDTCIREANSLLTWGIPIHAGKNGDLYFLSEKTCDYLTEDDAEFLLEQPVFTDAVSVRKLIEKGYGSKILATVKLNSEKFQGTSKEIPTEHQINEGLGLVSWQDNRFFGGKGGQYSVEGEHIERITDWHSNETGECLGSALAIVETVYGAKWMVKGADVRNGMASFRRRNQLVRTMHYITGKPFAAYLNSAEQVVLIPRVNREEETVSVTLLNACISETEEVEVVIQKPANTECCIVTDPYEGDIEVPVLRKDGRYTVTVPPIGAWRTKSILFKAKSERQNKCTV